MWWWWGDCDVTSAVAEGPGQRKDIDGPRQMEQPDNTNETKATLATHDDRQRNIFVKLIFY